MGCSMTEGISVFMMSPDVFLGYIILGSVVGSIAGRAVWEITKYVIQEQERLNGDGPDLPKNPNASA